MANWFFPDDHTPPVFTAENHLRRKFPDGRLPQLPPKAVMFCLGDALRQKGFTVLESNTVTTDAPYRQTFHKEALWRQQGCVGVDMEASAVGALCNYYGMRCTVALMASDKHPTHEGDKPWVWGSLDFRALRDDFIGACIAYSLQ